MAFGALAHAERPMRVLFVHPRNVDGFWEDVSSAMGEAARQLGIHLEVETAPRWPTERLPQVERWLTGAHRPDYLITTTNRLMGAQEIALAERLGVPVFLVNAGMLERDRSQAGAPRERHKGWLGEMLPDEARAGRELAEALLEEARRRRLLGGNLPVEMLALGGQEVTSSGVGRNQGLLAFVEGQSEVRLPQVVPSHYNPDLARSRVRPMLRRYPEARMLWCASDQVALAAWESASQEGRSLILGGINWHPAAIQAVQQGRMTATVGGHVLEGAFALVLLFDHHHGVDFASEGTVWRTRMLVLNRRNVDRLAPLLVTRSWHRLDFRALSRVKNPALRRHDFSLAPFLGRAR